MTLCSTLEVYGTAVAPLAEDQRALAALGRRQAAGLARPGTRCCSMRRVRSGGAAAWCREMLDADPTGRWVYGMAKRAQELLVTDCGRGRTTSRSSGWRTPSARARNASSSRLARRALGGRTLEVTHPASRSFVPVEHVGRVIDGDPGPGVFIVGSPSVELMTVAERIVEALGPRCTLQARTVSRRTAAARCADLRSTPSGLGVQPVETWLDGAVAVHRRRASPPPSTRPSAWWCRRVRRAPTS